MNLETICNAIIVFGSAYFMIGKIINSFAKPTSKLKKKQADKYEKQVKIVLDKIIPDYLYQHDLETRDRYLNDRLNYLKEIKLEVLKETEEILKELKEINVQQSKEINEVNHNIQCLNNSSRDVLRQKIMSIYHKNKKNATLTIFEYENLQELFKDYKAQHGNSYIDKYYNRMMKWAIIQELDMEE